VDRVRRRVGTALFVTAGAIYVVDRLTKLWAERSLDRPIDLIPGAVTLRFTTNSGGAFSIGQSAPWIFAGITVVVSLAILATAFRHRELPVGIAFGLILGGALGNLTDRVVRGPGLRGRVVDFVDLHAWPVFNAADAAIVVGAGLLAWSSLRAGRGGDAVGRDDA
jgi:signal peptidase II